MQTGRSLYVILLVLLMPFTTVYAKDLNKLLINAAKSGDITIVASSLSKGADANAKNPLGESALAIAAKFGHVEVVQVLLDKGEIKQNLSDQINYLKIIEIDAKRGVVLVLREIIIEAGIQTGELPYQWKQKLN